MRWRTATARGDTASLKRRTSSPRRYRELLAVVRDLGLLAGFCYTQFTDTYQEANGLLRADRTPKIPLQQIAAATAGPSASRTRWSRADPTGRRRGRGAVMHKRALSKPDGRQLLLYGRSPISERLAAPSPSLVAHAPNAHLRWHPLRGEWVAYAGHRQHRTFLPPAEYNPLAPTSNPDHPTEVPPGSWDVAVFENLFPTFTQAAHDPPAAQRPDCSSARRLRGRGVHTGRACRRSPGSRSGISS